MTQQGTAKAMAVNEIVILVPRHVSLGVELRQQSPHVFRHPIERSTPERGVTQVLQSMTLCIGHDLVQ